MIGQIHLNFKTFIKTRPIPIIFCMITIFLFSHEKLHSQGFQTREVSDHVFMVYNPDLGNQVVVQSAKGLLVFDSFWSGKTAGIYREEISKTINRDDFTYVIDMVDRLDMVGGNAAYPGAVIVGHDNIPAKYKKAETVEAERTEMIEMWRHKEELARGRLEKIEKGSEKERKELEWMNRCKNMADEIESGFALVLPQITYKDRMTLDLGDITVSLRWFGETGNYRGLTMAVIPEEKLAVLSKSIIYPIAHLAPYPHPDYKVLDVPRWIALLEEILEGKNAVDHIILSDHDKVLSKELMQSHLSYIRKLWNSVKTEEAEGRSLREIQDRLSLEKDFAFVKEMQVYNNTSDNWIRPQHELHIRLFFLQHKNPASEIIEDGGIEFLQESLNKIRKSGSAVYVDEISIWRIGYVWMNMGHISEAIDLFKLNAEAFPGSFRVYDCLGEAYLKSGDKRNAIINYRKSLELNPGNSSAKAALDKLEKQKSIG